MFRSVYLFIYCTGYQSKLFFNTEQVYITFNHNPNVCLNPAGGKNKTDQFLSLKRNNMSGEVGTITDKISHTTCLVYHTADDIAKLNHYRTSCVGYMTKEECLVMKNDLVRDKSMLRFEKNITELIRTLRNKFLM